MVWLISQVTGITTVIIEPDWEIYALDANGSDNFNSGQSPDRLLDSDKSTGWTSYYNNDTSTPPLPYYLFIDMKETTDVNGVFLAGNNSDFAATKLIIETPVNQDIINDPLDENIVWRKLCRLIPLHIPSCPILKVRVSMIFRQKNK